MKKNSPDSTLRNIQAANKKLSKLFERIKKLESELKRIDKIVKSHSKAIDNKWA